MAGCLHETKNSLHATAVSATFCMLLASGVSCYVQVTVAEEHLGTVLGDLSSLRRAQIHEVLVRQEARLICAHIPLASLVVRWI